MAKPKKRNKKYAGKWRNELPWTEACQPLSEKAKQKLFSRPLMSAKLIVDNQPTEVALGDIGCVTRTMLQLSKNFVEEEQLKTLARDAYDAFVRIAEAFDAKRFYSKRDALLVQDAVRQYCVLVENSKRREVWNGLKTAKATLHKGCDWRAGI